MKKTSSIYKTTKKTLPPKEDLVSYYAFLLEKRAGKQYVPGWVFNKLAASLVKEAMRSQATPLARRLSAQLKKTTRMLESFLAIMRPYQAGAVKRSTYARASLMRGVINLKYMALFYPARYEHHIDNVRRKLSAEQAKLFKAIITTRSRRVGFNTLQKMTTLSTPKLYVELKAMANVVGSEIYDRSRTN